MLKLLPTSPTQDMIDAGEKVSDTEHGGWEGYVEDLWETMTQAAPDQTVLMWAPPKKVRTPEENADHAGFDGGPTGGYQPNMSDEDANRWRAKITGQQRGTKQVEIRKTLGGSMVTIIVTLDGGYTYKHYKPGPTPEQVREQFDQHVATNTRNNRQPYWTWEEYEQTYTGSGTDKFHIHFAANGPLQMTWNDMADMQRAIYEAKAKLESLDD